MKLNKKAQGLSLNTVVIAVLVLIVLAILIFITQKYIYGTGIQIGELAKCEAREGSLGCVHKKSDCNGNAIYKMGCPSDKDKLDGDYCCIIDKYN